MCELKSDLKIYKSENICMMLIYRILLYWVIFPFFGFLIFTPKIQAQTFIDDFYAEIPYAMEREQFDAILWYTSCASVQVAFMKKNVNFEIRNLETDIFFYLDAARAYHNYYYPSTNPSSFEFVFSLHGIMSAFYYLSEEDHVDIISYCENTLKLEIKKWMGENK